MNDYEVTVRLKGGKHENAMYETYVLVGCEDILDAADKAINGSPSAFVGDAVVAIKAVNQPANVMEKTHD